VSASAIFARAGHDVALYDSAPGAVTAALPAIESTLASMAAADLVDYIKVVMARIRPCETLEDALDRVDYIQESVIEEVEVKRTVFRMLDDTAPPDAVIASSVSSIPPSEFMANLKGGALHRRPSGQSAASYPGGGGHARAIDQRGNLR